MVDVTTPPPPSRNPTDDDSLLGVLNIVLRKFLMGLDDMLPAQVISFNRATGNAQVKPLMSIVLTNNELLQRAPILSVPVQQTGGGNFMSNFPIKPGDLGFIKSNDRDISLFKQSFSLSIPNTARLHSFSDAIFLPMVMTGFTIAGSDADRYVLQSLNGGIRLSMGTGNVLISDDPAAVAAAGAVLDVQSTTKAFKIPRMTHGQRDAIPSPEGGMMVYVTDAPTGFSSYTDGIGWS